MITVLPAKNGFFTYTLWYCSQILCHCFNVRLNMCDEEILLL
jgi:hypothetical protein